MAIITLKAAKLAFGHYPMLDNADFSLEKGEKIGLIGRNGTGKSSLLEVLAGIAQLDDGLITRQKDLRFSFVRQEPQLNLNDTIFECVAAGLDKERALWKKYQELTQNLDASSKEQLQRLHVLQEELDHTQAWEITHRIDALLERLALNKNDKVSTLSGGLYKRVAIAQALAGNPDVLLLDEPTNHLDYESIRWLESFLKELPISIVFITHDRTFLDNVATRIVELDRGRLLSFPGNFSQYKKAKKNQLSVEAIENAKFDKVLAQEEVWIRKGIEARRTRNEGRVRRLLEFRKIRAERRDTLGRVKMDVSLGEKSGRLVAELQDVSKSFNDKTLVNSFSEIILRGDKIGIIGPNGIGKTTLLKLILGELKPDSGHVVLGTKLQIAYFDQKREQLNDNDTLAQTISPGSDWVEIGQTKKHVLSYLGDFLFTPERARSPVSSLSGGERNRLLLARLFARPANVLVLDEPTNDLDIETLELLEELLIDYEGTVFLVSHDRTFLDNVVTQVIAPAGDGTWKEYVGGFSDWERQTKQNVQAESTAAKKQKAPPKKKTENTKPKKLSYQEQRELDQLPNKISQLEAEQASISSRLNDPAMYANNNQEGIKLNKRFVQIEEELLTCLARWEELEAKKSQ